MVDIREERTQLKPGRGHSNRDRRVHSVWFNEELSKQIAEEARRRSWSFSHMVRFLCEASIEGIE